MISSKIPLKYQKIIAIVGIPFIIVMIIIAHTVCNPMTVVTQGAVLSIPPQHDVQYDFTRPSNGAGGIYGEFSSDHPVTLYVMNATPFSQFESTGYAPSSVYSSGQVTLTTVGGKYPFVYIKQPGQYHLVFYNAGSLTATVIVTLAMAVETC